MNVTTWKLDPETPPRSTLRVVDSAKKLQATAGRPRAHGKFLFVGDSKFHVRGVTYGTFAPNGNGAEFPARAVVRSDLRAMAENGINALRTYTPAPEWLLDAAAVHGIRVLVGIPTERSAAFLDYRSCARSLTRLVRQSVRLGAKHPAILGYALGNEIPSSTVRWHGRAKVERLLAHLYDVAKGEDPDGIVTYVNYPSTEYLHLPFLDVVAFNVYLESRSTFDAYLARLHNIAAGRPVIMTEIGLDSVRNGEPAQATALASQVRSAFDAGCAGTFVYAWTDEWFRGGAIVTDWRFGITDAARKPKPALEAVRRAYAEVPFPSTYRWPGVSVVICTRNGSKTLKETCGGVRRLEYPDYETIVVDDGSSDDSGAIAAKHGFRVIRTPGVGLSRARNLGFGAARNDFVAYLDDDAHPDAHWLHYLALALRDGEGVTVAGAGGPNLPPPSDGLVARCVARAPGGPSHVLISDRVAEHLPGCNMAFRKSALQAIGGFDPQFRTAGDDVDLCWRLLDRGHTLAFAPAAVVWHHRRGSIRAFLKQQRGYGDAEAALERKWPRRYNAAGQATWRGRVYDTSLPLGLWRTGRIYHGVWGTAAYQALYAPAPGLLESYAAVPEWYLVVSSLGVLSILGTTWTPLLFSVPLFALATALPVLHAFHRTARLSPPAGGASWGVRVGMDVITAGLHVLQPCARLYGRIRARLGRFQHHRNARTWLPLPRTADVWSRTTRGIAARLEEVERHLCNDGAIPIRGTEYDRWDLEIGTGLLGAARLSVAVEPHGSGKELIRVRCWPIPSLATLALIATFSVLAAAAATDGRFAVAWVLTALALALGLRTFAEIRLATDLLLGAVRRIHDEDERHATT